jgi:hypothetical protein
MPRLLVVHHTPSSALQAMFEAAVSGTRTDEIDGVEVVVRPALTAAPVEVLEADGYLLGTPVQLALGTLQRIRPARNQLSATARAVLRSALPAVVDQQGDASPPRSSMVPVLHIRGRAWSRAAHTRSSMVPCCTYAVEHGPVLHTSPAGPICAENPAVAETLGNWDCPELPRKPYLPQ